MTCHHEHSPDDQQAPAFSRRKLLQVAGAATVALNYRYDAFAVSRASATAAKTPQKNRDPLSSQPYYLLPMGSIKPSGWLRRQLEIQASGLGGRLDEVWEDVGPKSGWLGGDGESWERG